MAVFWANALRCTFDLTALLYFGAYLLLNRIVALGPALGRPAGRGFRAVLKIGCCTGLALVIVTVFDFTMGELRTRELLACVMWFNVLLVAVGAALCTRAFVQAQALVAEVARSAQGRQQEEATVARIALREQLLAIVAFGCTTPARLVQRGATLGTWPWRERWPGLEGFVDCADTLSNCLAALWLVGAFRGGLRVAQEEERRRAARASAWAQAAAAWAPHEDVRWQAKVRELSGRGITLEALLEFYEGLGVECMPHWDPERHTTADVVRQAVIPRSAGARSALATVLMRGTPARPGKMVTHNWGNRFADLVAAICADALGEDEFGRVRELLLRDRSQLHRWLADAGQLGAAYWICAFSVNQHLTICSANPYGGRDTVTGEPYPLCDCGLPKALNDSSPVTADGRGVECEVNKFAEMMRLLSAEDPHFEQVVAIDGDFSLFTRAWCLAELAAAHTVGMRQRLKLRSAADLEGREAQLRGLRIQDMQASRPEDKEEILAGIADAAAFNAALQRLLFEDLLPEWRCLDAEQQMHRVARLVRWQQAARRSEAAQHTISAGKDEEEGQAAPDRGK